MKNNVPPLTAKYAPEEALEDMEVVMGEAQGDTVEVESMVDTEAKEVQVDMVEVIFVFECTYICALHSKNNNISYMNR